MPTISIQNTLFIIRLYRFFKCWLKTHTPLKKNKIIHISEGETLINERTIDFFDKLHSKIPCIQILLYVLRIIRFSQFSVCFPYRRRHGNNNMAAIFNRSNSPSFITCIPLFHTVLKKTYRDERASLRPVRVRAIVVGRLESLCLPSYYYIQTIVHYHNTSTSSAKANNGLYLYYHYKL